MEEIIEIITDKNEMLVLKEELLQLIIQILKFFRYPIKEDGIHSSGRFYLDVEINDYDLKLMNLIEKYNEKATFFNKNYKKEKKYESMPPYKVKRYM